MQRHGDDVGDEHEGNAESPGRNATPEQAVPEDEPVADHETDLGGTRPGGRAEIHGAWREKVKPGKEVEVEAGDPHHGVICVFLVAGDEIGSAVPDVGKIIVGRM